MTSEHKRKADPKQMEREMIQTLIFRIGMTDDGYAMRIVRTLDIEEVVGATFKMFYLVLEVAALQGATGRQVPVDIKARPDFLKLVGRIAAIPAPPPEPLGLFLNNLIWSLKGAAFLGDPRATKKRELPKREPKGSTTADLEQIMREHRRLSSELQNLEMEEVTTSGTRH